MKRSGTIKYNTDHFSGVTLSNCSGGGPGNGLTGTEGVLNGRGEHGNGAGGISLLLYAARKSRGTEHNTQSFSDMAITNCSVGTNDQKWNNNKHGAAGGVMVKLYSEVDNIHNSLSVSDTTISGCSGGYFSGNVPSPGYQGGGAGGLAVSYYSTFHNLYNTHRLSNVNISNSSGGVGVYQGAGAGGIGIDYTSKTGSNMDNINDFSALMVLGCSGGVDVRNGGGAGGVSVSYYSEQESVDRNLVLLGQKQPGNINNIATFSRIVVRDCVGGTRDQDHLYNMSNPYRVACNLDENAYRNGSSQMVGFAQCMEGEGGGGAGGISISYLTYRTNVKNKHSFSNVVMSNCSGGNDTQAGGGAGGISISYAAIPSRTKDTRHEYNAHHFSTVAMLNCSGGYNTSKGGGAGGVSVSYFSWGGGSSSNSHRFMKASLFDCTGGMLNNQGHVVHTLSDRIPELWHV